MKKREFLAGVLALAAAPVVGVPAAGAVQAAGKSGTKGSPSHDDLHVLEEFELSGRSCHMGIVEGHGRQINSFAFAFPNYPSEGHYTVMLRQRGLWSRTYDIQSDVGHYAARYDARSISLDRNLSPLLRDALDREGYPVRAAMAHLDNLDQMSKLRHEGRLHFRGDWTVGPSLFPEVVAAIADNDRSRLTHDGFDLAMAIWRAMDGALSAA